MFLFPLPQKESKCGHPYSILYSEFVTMHILKRGKAGKEANLHPYVFPFLCPWNPHVWEGKKRRGKGSLGQHSEGEGDLPDPTLCLAGLIAKQIWERRVCHACSSLRCRIPDTGHAVLTQGSHGSSQAPVFSELRTLSSSGNYAEFC